MLVFVMAYLAYSVFQKEIALPQDIREDWLFRLNTSKLLLLFHCLRDSRRRISVKANTQL